VYKNLNGCSLKRAISNQVGFTFVELVMVIVIVGTLSAVVAPSFNTSSFNIRNGARVVASDILATQVAAMNSHTQVAINLAPGTTYTYGTNGDTRDLTGVNGSMSIATGSTITFNSLGEPVGLTAVQTVTVSSGGVTQNITVQPYTGKVSIP